MLLESFKKSYVLVLELRGRQRLFFNKFDTFNLLQHIYNQYLNTPQKKNKLKNGCAKMMIQNEIF